MNKLALGLALLTVTSICHATAARDTWDERCAKCHSLNGNGETKAGKKLNIKDYTKPEVQDQLKDEEMAEAIVKGVTVDGKKKMEGYADLTPQEVTELVALVRSFRHK